jgi:hypothetical protein
MKLKSTIMLIAFALLSALSAQSANVKISSLPFNITAPGTYVLTTNLTSTATNTGAINISTAAPGPVVLDLKGFSITGPGGRSFGVTVGYVPFGGSNAYPVTIRNGTLNNFEYEVWAEGASDLYLSDITVNNIVFNVNPNWTLPAGYGIDFQYVNSSTISNCTFITSTYGISDTASAGGNSYNNNTFESVLYPVLVEVLSSIPLEMDRCQFSPPPSN